MTRLEAIRIVLTVASGICWTVVYVEGIRVGFKDKSYAIPFYALALNFAWELQHTIFGFRAGASLQTIINPFGSRLMSASSTPISSTAGNTFRATFRRAGSPAGVCSAC